MTADQRRDRASRCFLVSAAVWLLLPLDTVALGTGDASGATIRALALDLPMVVPPAAISLWAARLTRDDRGFRSAMLSRAIAVANLLIALLYAAAVGGVFGALFSSSLALGSASSLVLLGDRSIDIDGDSDGELDPVRFRGVLMVALVLAFADAMILGFSGVAIGVRIVDVGLAGLELGGLPRSLALTGAAALLMVANVRGLLRLRVWAMFGATLGHLVISELAIQGAIAINSQVTMMLAVTAAVQLLLLIPFLAAALGDSGSHARLGWIVRVLVLLLVVATIVTAARNFGPGLPEAWVSRAATG